MNKVPGKWISYPFLSDPEQSPPPGLEEVPYIVTFESNDGTQVDSQEVYHGNSVIKPEDPYKSLFLFENWYKEEELINPWNFNEDIVTEDITLYANWVVIENFVGGAIGIAGNGNILNDCYYQGNIKDHGEGITIDTPYYVGGFLGKVEESVIELNMKNCYVASLIETYKENSGDVGAFIGSEIINPDDVFESCYFDADISKVGQIEYPGLNDRLTPEMKAEETYIDWDFDSVWSIIEDETYPCLLYNPCFSANFSAENRRGLVPLEVSFKDMSRGNPVVWEWDFGDGSSSNEKNPIYVYKKPGRYMVSLTIRSIVNEVSISTKKDYVYVVNRYTEDIAPDPNKMMFPDGEARFNKEVIGSYTYIHPDTDEKSKHLRSGYVRGLGPSLIFD